MRVPQNLSVASLNGTEEASFTGPALTASRQPIDAMAPAAVAAVLAPRPRGHIRSPPPS